MRDTLTKNSNKISELALHHGKKTTGINTGMVGRKLITSLTPYNSLQ